MNRRIRVSQVSVPLKHSEEHLIKKACRIAGLKPEDITGYEIIKRSLDARHDILLYSYTVDLIPGEKYAGIKQDRRVMLHTPVIYSPKPTGSMRLTSPIAIVGSGPAGLFSAYLLAINGYNPLIFERGSRVELRRNDVNEFWKTGRLNPDSNVQFGEGGAGTFSDGKLNTRIKDKSGRIRYILETFVRLGAPEDILYDSHPHIGTDILAAVVKNMREEIVSLGGKFYFNSAVTDIEISDGCLSALEINGERKVEVSAAVFATGHSARDTFAMLYSHGVSMEAKAFAVGMRVEHTQEMIDKAQYGENSDMSLLPPAAYKLSHRAANGRSVYSFCMCPGGYIIDASSEKGCLAINGMSERNRDSGKANSAVIVSVTPEDFPDRDCPLSGVSYQRELEKKAYEAGKGCIPQESFGEFAGEYTGHTAEDSLPNTDTVMSDTKGRTAHAKLRTIFPEYISEAFVEGMHAFGKKIAGFDAPETLLFAVESRTSSPVRILRNAAYESPLAGLYPCGEGAGYAGGISSSAVDGLKTAEALMKKYMP